MATTTFSTSTLSTGTPTPTHTTSASNASTATSTSLTDDTTWEFSIKEDTIRNVAITLGITLGVLLICALVAIEVMRRRMKKIQIETDECREKLRNYKGIITPSLSSGRSRSLKAGESGVGGHECRRGGYEPVPSSVPPSAVEGGRTEYQNSSHLQCSALESGRRNVERVELSGTEGRVPVAMR